MVECPYLVNIQGILGPNWGAKLQTPDHQLLL